MYRHRLARRQSGQTPHNLSSGLGATLAATRSGAMEDLPTSTLLIACAPPRKGYVRARSRVGESGSSHYVSCPEQFHPRFESLTRLRAPAILGR